MVTVARPRSITRDLELESLQDAVRWPHPSPRTILALAGRFLARGHHRIAYDYFRERASEQLDKPLFESLAGLFQVRAAAEQPLEQRLDWIHDGLRRLQAAAATPGLPTYFRGVTLAELPASFDQSDAAVADLEWVLNHPDWFPVGFRRPVHRALARVYRSLGRDADARAALERSGVAVVDPREPIFSADYWLTTQDGFHFVPPRLVELASRVYVAQGYDLSDLAFVVTSDGIVAIDTGTTEAHARAAFDALREVTDAPIRKIILTHAHWDHIGGLAALATPDTEVIAQRRFAEQLNITNATGVGFRLFFAGQSKPDYHIVPDRLVERTERIVLGDTTFDLHAVHGGETEDALLVHVPERGVVFAGDVLMPYLGVPFLPEGSAEQLFTTMRLIRQLSPTRIIHGHTPLTDVFTINALPALESTLRELNDHVQRGVRAGRNVVDLLHDNLLPESLREAPSAVMPYIIMRENVVRRVYHQRTGYWKPDGEGVDIFSPDEWAAALGLLAGDREDAFVRTAELLLQQDDEALALSIVELGLRRLPGSRSLAEKRRDALDRLRLVHQQLNPWKFVVYSEWAGAELAAVA